MHLRHISAAHADANRVPPRVARVGLHDRIVLAFCGGVSVSMLERNVLVLVDGRPVVVFRMIVADVLVYVPRRRDNR
jgi:hypothetical protein